MKTFQYDAKVPASVAVAGRHPEDAAVGVGRWTSPTSATTATTASAAFQNGNVVNLNASTSARRTCRRTRTRRWVRSTVPGASAYTDQSAAAVSAAWATSTEHDGVPRTRTTRSRRNFNRRFRNGFCFGVNYTLSLSFTGNTGLSSGCSTRRRHDLGSRRPGGVRGAEQAAEPPARTSSRPTGCGACRTSRPPARG